MPTDLGTLERHLGYQTGLTLTSYELQQLLIHAVPIFNTYAMVPVTVSGITLDRTLDDIEIQIMVLSAALLFLDQKIVEWSLNAVVHSNVAGRTDLTTIQEALRNQRDNIAKALKNLADILANGGIAAEIYVTELGELKPYATSPPTYWPTL